MEQDQSGRKRCFEFQTDEFLCMQMYSETNTSERSCELLDLNVTGFRALSGIKKHEIIRVQSGRRAK